MVNLSVWSKVQTHMVQLMPLPHHHLLLHSLVVLHHSRSIHTR